MLSYAKLHIGHVFLGKPELLASLLVTYLLGRIRITFRQGAVLTLWLVVDTVTMGIHYAGFIHTKLGGYHTCSYAPAKIVIGVVEGIMTFTVLAHMLYQILSLQPQCRKH